MDGRLVDVDVELGLVARTQRRHDRLPLSTMSRVV
jgi:hypothetical protein